MDFNDKPKEESGGPKIKLPEMETPYGTLALGRVGKGAGITLTKKFYAKGGMTGYRKVADGCAQRGKTRGKMV